MKKEKIFCLTSVWVCTLTVSAQDTIKNKQLNEVVISATRIEKNINDVGRSITVISSDEIKKSGVNTVSELLSQQAGIYVVGTGQNPGMTSSIFTRGSNSNQTILMIDGVRITDPSAINNSIDMAELSLANIDKIEIVRGSHSTYYGSAAIGGVVNVITKKSKKEGVTADVAVTVGTFGKSTSQITENAYVNYQLKNGIYTSAEVMNTNVNGLNATVDTITNASAYKHSDKNDGFDKLDWLVKAGYINQKWDTYFSFKQTKQIADIDKAAYKDDDNYTVDFKRNLITYGASYKLNEKIKFNYIGGYTSMKRIAIDDSSKINTSGTYDKTFNRGIYDGTVLTNELQANYTRPFFNFVLGGGAYSETMNNNTSFYYYNQWGFPPAYEEIKSSLDTVDPNAGTANAFMHTEIGGGLFSDKLKAITLSGGLRFNSHSIFGNAITYEINPSVKVLDGGLLYATYATGFNSPSLYQLYSPVKYFTWDTQYSTGLSRGNKLLNPEISKTFEIGFKQSFNNISFSAAYFKTVIENAIEYVYLWDKNVAVDSLGNDWMRDDYRGDTYLNFGTLTTEGVELGVSSAINDKLSISANVSLLSGKLTYNQSMIDTAQTKGNHVQVYSNGAFISNKEVEVLGLTRRPNTANLSITYLPIKKIALRADLRHSGARNDVYYESNLGPYGALGTVAVKQYTLVDASVRATIYKGLSASLRVENIFDKKYYEINGFTTRGRGVYFTVRYNL